MKIHVRREEEKDYRVVEELTKAAFTRSDYDCDEHFIVHQLRQSHDCVIELNMVLEVDGKVIGHIIYSKSVVCGDKEYEVLTFGPVSILPSYQHKGYGALLIRKTLEKAKSLGYRGVVIYGHKEYYPRFGFQNAKTFDIQTSDGKNGDYFMALELQEGGLTEVSGRLILSDVFDVDPDEFARYKESFNQNRP